MSKHTKKKREIKPEKRNIQFLVEGATEEHYLKALLKDIKYTLSVRIKNIEGGSYEKYLVELQKNPYLDIVLIIADLDEATNTNQIKGRDNLQKLIKELIKKNSNNNIFLTYQNFDTWLEATLPKGISLKAIYKDTHKGKEDISKRIKDKGGSFELGIGKFSKDALFYTKEDINTKGKIEKNNIDKEQSNLIYFIEYLQKLDAIEK